MEVRVIIDPPAAGAWNMAVDEALLRTASEQQQIILRFYQWQPATLSLGYFQRLSDRAEHPASLALPVVRRASGGGAIVHDRELTYSLALPLAHTRKQAELAWYRALHETARDLLQEWGVPAEFWSGTPSPRDDAPFLCFQRRSAMDLVAGPHKLLGSAQRRSRTALLQHGSLLLGPSPAAPELPGAGAFETGPLDPHLVSAAWQQAVSERVGWRCQPSALRAAERDLAQSLAVTRFSGAAWTARRA
jgi:lipoate-protein ligase A